MCIAGVLRRTAPRAPALPLVVDSPHSGRVEPPDFGHAIGRARLLATVDALVDDLFDAAPQHGATLLRALFPRTYIDPNRAPDDIDETLLAGRWPGRLRPSEKCSVGIGLIARRDPIGPIYDRALSVDEVRTRIERYWWPYHRALGEALDTAHRRFGACWYLDCHSMRPLVGFAPGTGPDFVLGDGDGTTCEPELTALVADALRSAGYRVALNDPYKGAELIRRHCAPARGRHGLQIEVSRALYLDAVRFAPGPGFERLRADLTRLLGVVADHVRARLSLARAAE
ncbi:MAG: N-formylglutamate amidohydrolase [Ectothiorhodospiraceae bacterium]|nr:N-formylglutamate amidohydrolase [Chromatiales bacterium]MCP5154632.1 N-formylglutamate amidohydrolase [Ectothiorhodospiraceae bacterium]